MTRSGEFVSNLSGEATYKSFRPTPLPPNPELVIGSDMVKKLVEANRVNAIEKVYQALSKLFTISATEKVYHLET